MGQCLSAPADAKARGGGRGASGRGAESEFSGDVTSQNASAGHSTPVGKGAKGAAAANGAAGTASSSGGGGSGSGSGSGGGGSASPASPAPTESRPTPPSGARPAGERDNDTAFFSAEAGAPASSTRRPLAPSLDAEALRAKLEAMEAARSAAVEERKRAVAERDQAEADLASAQEQLESKEAELVQLRAGMDAAREGQDRAEQGRGRAEAELRALMDLGIIGMPAGGGGGFRGPLPCGTVAGACLLELPLPRRTPLSPGWALVPEKGGKLHKRKCGGTDIGKAQWVQYNTRRGRASIGLPLCGICINEFHHEDAYLVP